MLKFCPENPCKAANFWPRYPSNPNFGGFKNFLFLRNIFGYPILGFLTLKSTKQAWQNHFCHQKYDQITNLYVEILSCCIEYFMFCRPKILICSSLWGCVAFIDMSKSRGIPAMVKWKSDHDSCDAIASKFTNGEAWYWRSFILRALWDAVTFESSHGGCWKYWDCYCDDETSGFWINVLSSKSNYSSSSFTANVIIHFHSWKF